MPLAKPLITLDKIDPDDVEDIIDGLHPGYTLVEYGYFDKETGEFFDVHIEHATGAYFGILGFDTLGKVWIEEITAMRRVQMHKTEYLPL